MAKRLNIAAILIIALFPIGLATPLFAQNGVVPAGGNVKNATGSLSFSFGQPADAILLTPNMTNEGLQQPYRPDSTIWNREVCQGLPFVEAPFNITALQTATPGLHVFRDTMLNVNRFGGDSIIVLKLTVNPAPELAVSTSSDPTCATYNDGSITLAGSAGTSPYEYRISTGNFASSASFTGLIAGDYKFYVKDNKGCIDSVEQTLTDPFAITFTPTASPATICNGTSTTLAAGTVTGGAGGYTYLWSATGTTHGLPDTKTTSSLSASPTATTTYTLRVTDANNCHIDNTVDVTVNSLPSLAATPDAPSCNGGNNGSITLVASGGSGSDYEFKLGTGSYDDGTGTNHENYTISDLTAATDYAVTVKDGNGCEYTLNDIVVTEPTAITFNIMDDTALCNGASIKIGISTIAGGTVAGDYTIAWTANTANDVANMATTNTDSVVITPTASTIYTATVTDDQSCSKNHSVSVTVRANPTLTATPGNNPVLCNGSNTDVTLSATGGTGSYTYTMDNWANSQTTTTYSSLTAGDYTFRVRDAKGCTGFDNLSITEPAAITFSPRASITSICNGGSTTLDTTAMPTGGTGAYTYNWTADNANAGLPGTTNVGEITVTPTATTVYTLTVSDANTCSHSETITINVGSNPSLAIAEQTNVNCFGATTGAATLVATGGSGDNYQFKFGTADYADGTGSHHDTIIYTSLSAATTTITVKDGDGCTATQDLTITQPSAALAISAISATPSTICLGATSTLAATVEGGTTPYTYAWTTSNDPAAGLSSATATSPTATPTAYGSITYTLTITDDKGCTATDNVTLTINNLDTVRFLYEEICGGETYNLHGFNEVTTRRTIDQTVRDTNRASSVLSGCDSTTVLALTVKHVDSVNIAATINGGATYNLNGFNVTPARSNTTYIYTPTPTNNNTNVGGCDSITTLTLTVRATDSTTIDTFICSNIALPFNWRGKSFAAAGTQYSTLTGAQGQDSVLVLNLAIHSTSTFTDNHTACGSYNWIDGNTYTATNSTATHVIPNVAGCDSTITLNLTIHTIDTTRFLSEAICGGNTYTDHNFNIATTRRTIDQTIRDTMRLHSVRSGALNCDSTVVLNLTINHVDSVNIAATINGGTTYNMNGFNVTPARSNTTYIYTPTPTNTDPNVGGCDSITTLTLTVRATDSTTIDTFICSNIALPFNWRGVNFAAAGTQYKTIAGAQGQDSVLVLNLAIHSTSTFTDNHTACGSYNWIDGTTYTASNSTATHVIPNVAGCDSTITLNLTIHTIDTTRFLSEAICGGNTYTDHNFNIATTRRTIDQTIRDTMRLHSVRSGALNCDSTVVLNLTVNHVDSVNIAATINGGTTYNLNGFNVMPARSNTSYIYTPTPTNTDPNVGGCDSITTLTLTVRATDSTTIDTFICSNIALPFNWRGVNFAAAGTQYSTLTGAQGQDSVLVLNLAIHSTSAYTDNHTACGSYTWINGTTYTASNSTDTKTLTNAAGCDSVVTLNLTIHTIDTTRFLSEAICGGNTYTDYNFNIATTRRTIDQTIRDTMRLHSVRSGALNCDSTVVLNLTVNHVDSVNIAATINGGATYNLNGFDVTPARSNTTYIYTPTPTHTDPNVGSCDSITTLTLTVRATDSTTIDTFICSDVALPFTWREVSFSGATTQYKTITGSQSQDSVLVLNLAIHSTSALTDNQTACGSYTWINGTTYTASNSTDTKTLTNAAGCDSVVTLNLTIHTIDTTRFPSEDICGGNTYTDHNFNIATMRRTIDQTIRDTMRLHSVRSGALNCDSTVVLNLTVNHVDSVNIAATINGGATYNQNGFNVTPDRSNTTYIYTPTPTHTDPNVGSCDSITTLTLTVRATDSTTIDTFICSDVALPFTWRGVSFSGANTQYKTITGSQSQDSVLVLNLAIHSTSTFTDNHTACGSYTWINGTTYTASNSTETKTLTNAAGCDSIVTLNLTIHTIDTTRFLSEAICGGNTYTDHNFNIATTRLTTNQTIRDTVRLSNIHTCDSTVILALLVKHVDSVNIAATVKGGEAYNANGFTITPDRSNTTYIYTPTPTHTNNSVLMGCDSITTLTLTVLKTDSTRLDTIICNNTPLPFIWHGESFSADDTKYTTLAGSEGQDSVLVLNLEIRANTFHDTIATACDSFVWYGNTYYASNAAAATRTITNASGCDSIVTLNLTIGYSNAGTDTRTVCDSLRWIDGNLYTVDNYYPATFVLTGGNQDGCDSTVTLNLTINHSNTGIDDQTHCDSLRWIDGNLYTASNNTARDTLVNAAGCDSVITLNLTINRSTYYIDAQTRCDSLRWIDGNLYTASNTTARDTMPNAVGCDSVITLNLTVNYSNTGIDIQRHCDTYTWIDGITYTASNTTAKDTLMNRVGCDSVVTLNLTMVYSSTGTDTRTACDTLRWIDDSLYSLSTDTSAYRLAGANQDGCDSIVTLNLTVNYSDAITLHDTICFDALPYTFGGQVFDAADTKIVPSTNIHGCDSTTTLVLRVNSTYNVPDSRAICATQLPYLWNNTTFVSGGSMSASLTSIDGCDSTVNMTLTVSLPVHSKTTHETCYNYTWTIRDSVYFYNTIGLDTHIHVQPLPTGCNATDTLILTLHGNDGTVTNLSACDSHRWDSTGITYKADTTVWHNFISQFGCPSADTLHLTIHINSSHADTLTGCDSLRWNRDLQLYTTDGTYTASYNDDNGCPSTDTLVLTIKPSSHNPYNVNTCNSFTWLVNGDYGTGNGNTYTTAGTYVSNYTNASGCTSSDTLHLRLRFSQSLATTQSACDSFLWVNNGNVNKYYTSGTYYSPYLGINGCPSVDTLYLTLGHANAATDYHTVCDTLLWHDSVYRINTKGPKYVSTNASGCDSTTILNLTIFYSTSATEVVTRCGSYNWHDSLYTRSTIDSIVKMNEGGCDSILYLSLTITTGDSTDYNTTVCDSLEWNNRIYRQSVYGEEAHFVNKDGCDSVVTLNLTVRHSTASTIRLQGSNQVSYNDITYTATGTYNDRLTNLNNCDSFVTIQIVIIHNKPLPTIHAYKKKMVMVDHNPGDAEGQYVEYDAYRWYRNGVLIPSATLDQYSLPNYADLSGEFYCEVPTDITQQYWVYSNTVSFSAASKSIAEPSDALRLTLYPNPTRTSSRVNVVVASDDDKVVPGSRLTVFDLQGRSLFATDVTTATITFNADYPTGVYTVVFTTPHGGITTTKLIVK